MANEAKQFNKTQREPLRWLFVAEFDDGTLIKQTQEDKGTIRKGDNPGSAYTDVIETQKKKKLVAFHLEHVETGERASVYLETGAFVINNTPFHAHDQFFEAAGKDLRLIYHRETRVEQNTPTTVQADGSIKEDEATERHYTNRYFIGWQTTVAGKNRQATIAVG